jgi:hypothetical protein
MPDTNPIDTVPLDTQPDQVTSTSVATTDLSPTKKKIRYNPKSLANLKQGRPLKPGQVRVSDYLRNMCTPEVCRKLSAVILAKALGGDRHFAAIALDRVEGTCPQTVQNTNLTDQPLQIVFEQIEKALEPVKQAQPMSKPAQDTPEALDARYEVAGLPLVEVLNPK